MLLRFRMSGWFWISLGLTLAIGLLAPHQLPVSLYKLSLITSAAFVGYWIDRGLFPYARPDRFLPGPFSLGAPSSLAQQPFNMEGALAFKAAQIRRAIIIAAAMIGVALGA